jgi:hypothetical protein
MPMVSRQTKETEQKIRILYEITRYVSSLLDLRLVLDAIVDLLWMPVPSACWTRTASSESRARKG